MFNINYFMNIPTMRDIDGSVDGPTCGVSFESSPTTIAADGLLRFITEEVFS